MRCCRMGIYLLPHKRIVFARSWSLLGRQPRCLDGWGGGDIGAGGLERKLTILDRSTFLARLQVWYKARALKLVLKQIIDEHVNMT